MTNEEAREILEKLIPQPQRGDGKSITHLMITEALTMAIEVLGQQSCDDCVNREAVAEMLNEMPMKITETWMDFYRKALNSLNKLPSVTPQPKWIPVTERLPEIGQRILVTYNQEDEVKIDITYYTKHGFLLSVVIAWMPLPQPYNAESEEEE